MKCDEEKKHSSNETLTNPHLSRIIFLSPFSRSILVNSKKRRDDIPIVQKPNKTGLIRNMAVLKYSKPSSAIVYPQFDWSAV